MLYDPKSRAEAYEELADEFIEAVRRVRTYVKKRLGRTLTP